nr:PPE domain-containing protein [Mycobacterium tuberculosis]
MTPSFPRTGVSGHAGAVHYAGAGSGPLFMAAAAWEGLAADLRASASSFDAVIPASKQDEYREPCSCGLRRGLPGGCLPVSSY